MWKIADSLESLIPIKRTVCYLFKSITSWKRRQTDLYYGSKKIKQHWLINFLRRNIKISIGITLWSIIWKISIFYWHYVWSITFSSVKNIRSFNTVIIRYIQRCKAFILISAFVRKTLSSLLLWLFLIFILH